MTPIRCTRKLLAELGIKPEAETLRGEGCGGGGAFAGVGVAPSPRPSPPGGEGELEALRATIGLEPGWHANLLLIQDYRCVLFTHDQTLFSFIVCRPGRLDAEHLPELFGQGLFKAMLRSGFSQRQVEHMLDAARDLRFARTNNRRVLGTMSDMAHTLGWTISDSGGLASTDPAELHRLLNETPYKAIGYDHAVERLRQALDARARRPDRDKPLSLH